MREALCVSLRESSDRSANLPLKLTGAKTPAA